MAKRNTPANDVPDGAAVFPLIPPELGINPLLLAALHALVFIEGSTADVVNAAAGEEAVQFLVGYLQRLQGKDLLRVREDIECLLAHARQEKWPREEMEFLRGFLGDYSLGGEQAGS